MAIIPQRKQLLRAVLSLKTEILKRKIFPLTSTRFQVSDDFPIEIGSIEFIALRQRVYCSEVLCVSFLPE